MGLVLGTCCAAQMACCFGSALCSCCCACLPPIKGSTSTRLMYMSMLSLVALLSIFMLTDTVQGWLEKISAYYDICSRQLGTDTDGSVCNRLVGYAAVYHICLAGFIFFTLMALLMICAKRGEDPRLKFDRGFWGWKFLLLVGIIVGVFFIPNSETFFNVLYVVGLIGGFLFILVQILMFLDFAHGWNESWVGKMEETDNKFWLAALIVSMVTLFATALASVILLFVFFSGCHDNTFLISLIAVLCVVISVISVLPPVQEASPRSGLLQPAFTSVFVVSLTWMGLTSDPRKKCNPTDEVAEWLAIALCLAYTNLTVIIASAKTGTEENSAAYIEGSGEESGGQVVIDDEEDEVAYNHSLYHLAMACACLFLMMTLTQWYSPNTVDAGDNAAEFSASFASKWVKVSSSWICIGVYCWILFAPMIFPDREF